MSGTSFTVLGRIAVRVAGVDRPVPGRRERAVLAVLLGAQRQVVSAERLVDEVWGSSPPETARGSLQVAVSRLRALLEPARDRRAAARLLISSGTGYALLADPEDVDAERFALLLVEAQDLLAAGDPDAALAAVAEAEQLWAGAPYPDVPGDLAAAAATRLQDQRLCLDELRAEALLAAGRPALVPAELEAFVEAHPFRERGWQLLALALYRSGRQADALAALRKARSVLVEELGVDPSPALQQLEADVLEQAPGLAATTPPHASSSAPTARATGAVPADGMVGREQALASARAMVAGLVDAHRGGTLVISGEAGIGKTRLAIATAELAAQRAGARVVWGRCHEADVTPAYWPWVPVVRELAGARPPAEVSALLSPDPVRKVLDAESAALRTYDAVARLVVSASQERPVMVVIEDLHWADSASLQLLAFAAEAWRDQRVLLLATVRIPEEAPDGLAACLAALGRLSASRVHLSGLDQQAVGELVGLLTGREADHDLAEVVAQRTDGNPFFVIELVRLLDGEHRLHPVAARDIAVPHGVQDVLRLRLARLDEGVRSLLSVAAVGGRDFRLDLVCEVAGVDPDDALELLEQALAASVVEEDADPGRYRFTHALVRETLAGSLSVTRRGRLHAAYGRALEDRRDTDPDQVAEVAHHLVLGAAMRPELSGPAVKHSVAAARLAEGRGALDQARVHWEQARSADDLARASDPERRFEVLVGLGRARYRQGDIAGSREALDAAVDLAGSMGDIARVAQAATSFRGAGVWHWREFGTSDPAMTTVLRECLERLPTGPLQARVLASLAMELMYEWRSSEAEPFGREAVDVARTLGDPGLFADVAALHELMLFGRPGATGVRLALAEEMFTLPLSQEQELYTRFGAANAHLQRGEAAQAGLQMARGRELARRLRHTGADVPLAWWRFWRAFEADDPAASALGEEALARHRRSSVVAIGDMEPAVELRVAGPGTPVPDRFVEQARRHPNPAFRAFVAQVLSESGESGRGLDILGDPVPDGAWDYASTYGDCMRVDVMASAGAMDLLPAALARIEPWQDELASYGSTECAGSVAYFVGRGREGLGDRAGAREAYARAVAANRSAGILPWLRRSEERLAAVDRR